jgi:hypothetical protein
MGLLYTELLNQVETHLFLPARQESQVREAECVILVLAGTIPTGDHRGKY